MYRDDETDYVLLTDNGSVDGGSLNAMILNNNDAKLRQCDATWQVPAEFAYIYESWKELSYM